MPAQRLIVVGKKLTEDLLFWEQLGRSLTPSPNRPTIVLHGAGEMTERSLEGDGLSTLDAGRDAATDLLIEAALRTENRRATTALTEGHVPAVGFLGMDRRLMDAAPESGPALRLQFLAGIAATGTIPVVGAVIRREGSGLVLPGLAEVVEASAPGPLEVVWLVSGRPKEPISSEDAVNLSGEPRLPTPDNLGDVSIRVSGVSAIG